MNGPLSGLPRLLPTRSRRQSTWDRTGGNDDRLHIRPGATVNLATIGEPGVIRHLWMTLACTEPDYLRKLVLRAFWDGEETPSVEAPVGDFFGLGHGLTRNFWSLPLQMSPEDGRGFNCWFPMPFRAARIEVESECSEGVTLLYCYVDYELTAEDDPDLGRFHAQWRRQDPCAGISESGLTNEEYQFGGRHLDAEGNYVVLQAAGHGHYVGCSLNVHNLRQVADGQDNWYGEGDDMIFVDGEPFPPSLHGTGTEDYINTAWCPTQPYSSPYHGVVLGGGPNWSGKSSLFRFHIEDPVRFERSIRVTFEHGHGNRRSDDWSSTAYWYQAEPHAAFPPLPAVSLRLPRPG
jgi:hypothetical protein